MSGQSPLRRDLLIQFGALVGVVFILAGISLGILIPAVNSTAQGILAIAAIILAASAAMVVLGSSILKRLYVRPLEQLAGDARRIADGDYRHRIADSESLEVQQVLTSVNEMAERLIMDQALLAENVASLEATNEALIEARDQVLQTARLASVGTLAAGIAHEVGNPLSAVIGFVDVAKMRAEKEGADTEILDAVRDEAGRIDRIVRGLLDYARPRDTEQAEHSPGQVLERVRELLENQGKLDRTETTWAVVGSVPDVVMDPHRLEQVMVNLILNALDALEGTPDPAISVQVFEEAGGVTRLPMRRAEDPEGINYMHRRRISKDDGGRGIDPVFNAKRVVVVQVDDNGPGIDEEDLDNVFDPFFTTKEPGKGTGLGLSICARLIEGMGGSIEAVNLQGGGASFQIRLPGVTEVTVEPTVAEAT